MVERDVNIIRHIEDYGFITIKQCSKMFFNTAAYGYDLARKRLAVLEGKGHIFSYIDAFSVSGEKIFYIDKNFSSPKHHTILIMDAYSEIKRLGAEILYFKREKRWIDDSRRSDAYTIFKIEDYLYDLFIEIEGLSTKKQFGREYTVNDMNKKYTDIINSREPQLIVNDIFKSTEDVLTTRRILIVDNITHTIDWSVDNQIVVQTPITFEKIGKILI